MRKYKVEELKRLTIEEFKNAEKTPLVIVLDNVRSLNNIGSVFRTADAFRVEAIYLCGITATPPHREIHKTALGATESVDWKYFNTTTDALKHLKTDGATIYAIEQAEGSIPLNKFVPPKDKRIALVFGNEINGVEENAMTLANGCIEIPQFGYKHSLNISVTAGVVVWDIFNKLMLD